MRKPALLKLGLIFLALLNYFHKIWAQELISKSKMNFPSNDQSTSEVVSVHGEKVIVAEGISCWEQNGHWEKLQKCPNSTIVTGHRFRYLVRSGLTAIQLKCTENYGPDQSQSAKILEINFENKKEKDLPRGKWGNWKNGSRSVFTEGFSFNRGELSLGRSVKNYKLIYHSGNQTAVNSDSDSDKVVRKCPEDHAICGLTAMMDKAQLGILTAIGLKCCHHCVPKEKWVTVHHYNNTGFLEEEREAGTTLGLRRSLKNSSDNAEIPHSVVYDEFSTRFGKTKSSSVGFDWRKAAYSIWTKEIPFNETYICEANSSCVLKQLVGQCGSVRVSVEEFCTVSVRIGSSIPDSCNSARSTQSPFATPATTTTPLEEPLDFNVISSCRDAMEILPSRSKKQWIYPYGNRTSLEVLCDFETDGGGWTIIQKRTSGPKHEFNQTWNEYVKGFGSLEKNFWMGLENIRALTNNGEQQLRIELEDFEGNKKYAKYSRFGISDASKFYRLDIDGFSGDANDSMTNPNYSYESNLDGMRFSTKDNHNYKISYENCAVDSRGGGGWWFNRCSKSNLNGLYYEKGETVSNYDGIFWYSWKSNVHSLAKTEMKIRTKKFHKVYID